MGWQDLLQQEDETIVVPWLGGRSLLQGSRKWNIKGKLPESPGWFSWTIEGRNASLMEETEERPEEGTEPRLGYLVGDRFVSDLEGGEVSKPTDLISSFERVRLLDPGIDYFTRISVDRYWHGGPIVFKQEEFPLGPEDDIRDLFLDDKSSVNEVEGVPPALDLVFRMAVWRKAEVAKAREEERLRSEQEERARVLRERLGDGELRREIAKTDFGAAAKAALEVGGAEYIDHRSSHLRNEYVVRYKVGGRRLECVVSQSLSVLDAGVCLTDEGTGEKGDTYFTLESLPVVILQAIREGVLVVWRHG